MHIRTLFPTCVALAAFAPCMNAQGGFRDARSTSYLFAASAADARAIWLNPGGIGVRQEASVMGEILLERDPIDGGMSVAQYGAGFNSRGVAFGYRRDRFDGVGGNTWRIGAGRALGRIAAGAAVTLYSGDPDQREIDLGLRYLLSPSIEVGAVVRHILEPVVRQVLLPVTGTAGFHLQVGPAVGLDAEATAADRNGASGFDMSYRAGIQAGGGGIPGSLLAAVDLDSDLGVARFVLGISVGGQDRGVLVADATRTGGTTRFAGMSLAGVATRSLVPPQGGGR